MDHAEVLRLLRGGPEGIKEWNQRRSAGEEIPDLNMADLRGANLHGANLHRGLLIVANLHGAFLIGARLIEANLHGANLGVANLHGALLIRARLIEANLRGADLRGADLSAAVLHGAVLHGAVLHGANLRGANLHGANLCKADLRGTNLGEAFCRGTIFADVDLSEVKGLDKIEHAGPSTVGIDTIFNSQGKIPEVFLRGCGMPDTLIAYLPTLIGAMSPIQFYSCFISYSSRDRDFADRLYADLQAKGIRCWLDREDLKIGDEIRDVIEVSIRVYDKLLLVLSAHSVASEWVCNEVETALEKERRQKRPVLFPIRLDDAAMEAEAGWAGLVRRQRHIGDFRGWKEHDAYQEAFARLLRDLEAEDRAMP